MLEAKEFVLQPEEDIRHPKTHMDAGMSEMDINGNI